MTSRTDLLRRLAAVADDLGVIEAPVDLRRQLVAMCRTARVALGAGSVSIARLDQDALVYDAADGQGADGIVGVRLPLTRGIASYVVRTGQSLIVEQVERDPRFARDVAERVGYVPTSLLATPIVSDRGDAIGAVSVLDRGRDGADALTVASAIAEQAALVIPQIDVVARLAPMLFAAVADAVERDDRDLAGALRRQGASTTGETADLAALLDELRGLHPDARAAAVRIVAEFGAFASVHRRRR
jgi:GAF domain-containing protein